MRVSLWLCSMHLGVCVRVSLGVYVHEYAILCVYVCVCVWEWTNVSEHSCVSAGVNVLCVCVFACLCQCVYVYMCVCAYACACVWKRKKERSKIFQHHLGGWSPLLLDLTLSNAKNTVKMGMRFCRRLIKRNEKKYHFSRHIFCPVFLSLCLGLSNRT